MRNERHDDDAARAAWIAAMVGGLDTPAPHGLRQAVEAAVAQAAVAEAPVVTETPAAAPIASASSSSRKPRRRSGWPSFLPGGRGFALGGGALAAVAAVVIAIVLATGGAGSPPAVPTVAQVALRTPTQPAPSTTTNGRLDFESDGVYFPDWSTRAGGQWQAVGERSDRIGDRDVRTVVYKNADGAQVHYAIAAGDALPFGAGGKPVTRNGVKMWVYDVSGGGTAVMWLRGGHTCIVSTRDVASQTLVSLVSQRT
ncbi:MAG TPA: hypothetical protein VGM91_19695 [Conexibacter sp.]|jgi:hypothetical protein